MAQISLSELKVNPGKYINMAQAQDIFITRNGKVVAKIVSARPNKKAAWDNITSAFARASFDLSDDDMERAREERILGR